MIYHIVNAFKETALKHKAILTFKYQDQILINAQPNNKHYSCIIETDPLFGEVNGNHTLTLNMDILGVGDELEVQDIASQIGLSIINKVVNDNRNIMSLRTYSILLFTKKSDDSCAGARFTIQLIVPSFMDLCIEDEYWLTDEEYEEKIAIPDGLDLGEPKEYKGLDLHPLKL